jgi:hypothetical protein
VTKIRVGWLTNQSSIFGESKRIVISWKWSDWMCIPTSLLPNGCSEPLSAVWMRPVPETDHMTSSSTDVKNVW